MANDAVRRTPAGYLAWLEEKIVALERRPPGGGAQADSGWISLAGEMTMESGWSQSGPGIMARRLGRIVFLNVTLSAAAGTFTVNTDGTTDALAGGVDVTYDFPAEWRPDFPDPGGGPPQGVMLEGNGCTLRVNQNGNIRILMSRFAATQTAPVTNSLLTMVVSGSYVGSAA